MSTVLKKVYFCIQFAPEKDAPRLIHNLYILSNFMLRKMFIKHSLERGRREWGFQSLSPRRREVWREVFMSLQTVSQTCVILCSDNHLIIKFLFVVGLQPYLHLGLKPYYKL